MHQGSLQFCEADRQYVTACLGRTPQGVVGVAARRPAGEPTVIINLPLQPHGDSWQPFPTLYWLVDPALNTAIAEIEREGGVRAVEGALAEDPVLLRAHRGDNACYAAARWALLGDREKQAADELGVRDMLEHSGVGGVANHDAVKCLQAQYAFHLARHGAGTAVGRLMEQRFGL